MLNGWLRNIHLPKWVIGILLLIFILRIPSFFEPYYYGDEMIYLTLGTGMHQGLTLYKDIHDNKPPLLYVTAYLAGNLFWFKVILAFWNIGTIVLFYLLSVKLFPKKENLQKISTFIFAILTTIPLFEGNIVNAELFMIAFSIGALILLLSDKLTTKKIFLAGILFGLGTLYKVPAAFDMPVIVVYWIITQDFRNWNKIAKYTLILGTGFALPLLLTIIWYFFKGALPEYIKAAFLQNVGYLSSFRPGDVQKPFLVRNGPLLIRAFIVFLSSATLYVYRKKLSKNFILFFLWTVFGLFAVTLSERPYPHYFIQVVAPVSFLLTMLIAEKSFEQALTVIPLAIAFFVPFYYKFYNYDTWKYYQRFINFASGRINKGAYFQSFASTVGRNYQIAQFLVDSSTTKDRVFIWDPDSAVIYALSRRLPPIKYVADYHINDYSSKAVVAASLTQKPPKFIILTSGYPFNELESLIKNKYLLITQFQNANVYSRRSTP